MMEAEPLLRYALAIDEKAFGTSDASVVEIVYNLASVYQLQGKYGEAEGLYERVLAIREKALGAEHPDTAKARQSLSAC